MLEDFLTSPTREELLRSLRSMEPSDALSKSIHLGLMDGVDEALSRGAEYDAISLYLLGNADAGFAREVIGKAEPKDGSGSIINPKNSKGAIVAAAFGNDNFELLDYLVKELDWPVTLDAVVNVGQTYSRSAFRYLMDVSEPGIRAKRAQIVLQEMMMTELHVKDLPSGMSLVDGLGDITDTVDRLTHCQVLRRILGYHQKYERRPSFNIVA